MLLQWVSVYICAAKEKKRTKKEGKGTKIRTNMNVIETPKSPPASIGDQ